MQPKPTSCGSSSPVPEILAAAEHVQQFQRAGLSEDLTGPAHRRADVEACEFKPRRSLPRETCIELKVLDSVLRPINKPRDH